MFYSFLSHLCSIQGITHGFCGFLLLLGGGVTVLAGRCWVLLFSAEIMMNNNIFNSIKTKGPSSDHAVALDVLLSSLKCDMSGTLQGRRDLYSLIWIPILDPNYRYRPTKSISLVSKGREHAPGLSVCLYNLSFVMRLVCKGFRACRSTSMTGHAKNIPFSIFAPFFPRSCDFYTNPRVVGSVRGSAPVEDLHYP